MNNHQTATRVFDLLETSVKPLNKEDVFACKIQGNWRKYSAQEVIDTVNKISLGLLKLGVKRDDKIALISNNRPEWNFVELGIQQIGAVSVPMYPTITIEDYHYIFSDADIKLIFVSDENLLKKSTEASKGIDSVEAIYTFDKIAGAKHWTEVLEIAQNDDVASLEAHKSAVLPDDLLTLIYTSGTTGKPKGVMLTHNNIIANVEGLIKGKHLELEAGDKALSFLPLCHIYERTDIYVFLRYGVSVYYAESMDTIADNLKEVKPHVFATVPRLLEKVYDKIVAKGYELTGVKKSLFFWALNLGLKYDPMKEMGLVYDIQLKIARKLIFSKWQEALGGNIKFIASGSAALQPRLSRVFWAAGVPIVEGYGLTETSPVISSSIITDFRIGCVGTVLPNVQVKIAEDGEILVKGPSIMKGYYNKPELTNEVIDSEGWFHTGDIGEFAEGRYLKITDRKKEIFKTSGGKYVAPQLLENKLKESIFVEQAIVVGEGEKFPSALLVPEFNALKEWCVRHEIPCGSNDEMVKQPKVLEKFDEEVKHLMNNVAKYEQVKKVVLLTKLFSIDSGELTPTLKLRRKVIHSKYQQEILSMYE
ncbi:MULTISPECIES: AMP-dependent synthetase/ligase [Bacteroidota]|uniref:Long-chain fatty acid--CoA ligase n=1 Tax=Flectobacillus rivi TaxID=2984209 RepID=A0ABT6Z035_9BACT|nr:MULTISPECIES: long-chain fatty acid--CoA ligase [Bacteroidota]MDI9874448.1 long-chain fatty acid--CoA ligase [Flectobacillus rivi]NBB28764.1 AMP-binding protein [Cellulophaga sp. BC115SP]